MSNTNNNESNSNENQLKVPELLAVADTVNPEVKIELRNTRNQLVVIFGDTHLGQDGTQKNLNEMRNHIERERNAGQVFSCIVDMGDIMDKAGKTLYEGKRQKILKDRRKNLVKMYK